MKQQAIKEALDGINHVFDDMDLAALLEGDWSHGITLCLEWLEADLDYLEALTPVGGGWRW